MPNRPIVEFEEPLPTCTPRRDLRHDDRFDTVEGFEVERISPGELRSPRLVSSAHGPIRHIMVWYPGGAKRSTYVDLLAKLPPATRVTIAAHPDSAPEVEEIAASAGDRAVEIMTTPSYLNFSVWAEDACVVVTDEVDGTPMTYLVEPFEFARYGDQVVVDLIAGASDAVASTQVPLAFQGGNMLIGDGFVLMGRDYLDETMALGQAQQSPIQGFPLDGSPEEKEKFARDLYPRALDSTRTFHFLESVPRHRPGPRVVSQEGELWLEYMDGGWGRRQPIFHIDMFVSLAGRASANAPYRVLVGDPSMADEIMGWEPVPHSLQSEYDEISAQLERLGFLVARTPLPLVPSYSRYRAPAPVKLDNDQELMVVGQIDWYHATANNCLVQIDGEARDVWLPTYGQEHVPTLAPLDARHREIWEELGFTVHQLADFHHLARAAGALHCIKKYLAR